MVARDITRLPPAAFSFPQVGRKRSGPALPLWWGARGHPAPSRICLHQPGRVLQAALGRNYTLPAPRLVSLPIPFIPGPVAPRPGPDRSSSCRALGKAGFGLAAQSRLAPFKDVLLPLARPMPNESEPAKPE